MLIDQIRTLVNGKAGLIEKIIYELQVAASMHMRLWHVVNIDKANVRKIVDYFTKEGFTVEIAPNDDFFPGAVLITISW